MERGRSSFTAEPTKEGSNSKPAAPSLISFWLLHTSSMAGNDSGDGEVSSAQAVLLGALAPGVNVSSNQFHF